MKPHHQNRINELKKDLEFLADKVLFGKAVYQEFINDYEKLNRARRVEVVQFIERYENAAGKLRYIFKARDEGKL